MPKADETEDDGWDLLRQGKHKQGIALLKRVVKHSPDERSYFFLALGYLFVGDYAAAGPSATT